MRFITGFPALLFSVLGSISIVTATTQCHDESFIPDAVLRVTQQNITQSCLASKTNVLINGTSPGPELRLLEGQTYWIRVYNDMTANNLTMVCTHSGSSLARVDRYSTALAWPLYGSLPV
jgi:L-ascorbate oxidase